MKGGGEGDKTEKHEDNSLDTGLPLLAQGQPNRSGLKNSLTKRFKCCETAAPMR